jgi:septal ring factor EnvC (AmiA/AmiB activator)
MAAPSFNTLSSVNFVAASDLNFVRPVSLVQLSAAAPAAAPAATPESSCQGNAARIRDLEERIDLLQDRLNKVQGNVAEQTEILREIAARIKSMPMSALPQ